jgi:hypothetical protein
MNKGKLLPITVMVATILWCGLVKFFTNQTIITLGAFLLILLVWGVMTWLWLVWTTELVINR